MSFNKAFPAYKKIDELIPKGLVIRMNDAAIPVLPILTTLPMVMFTLPSIFEMSMALPLKQGL